LETLVGSMNLLNLLQEQMAEVQQEFSGLTLESSNNGCHLVKGILRFDGEYEDKKAGGDYGVEITIPHNYPKSVPVTRSIDGKIPESFHTHPKDKTLCLGVPLAERMTFAKNPTLMGYIKKLVIPFLFSYSYLMDHDELPYGDLDHGAPGKLRFYKDLFDVEDFEVLGFLKLLADDRYKGHFSCPCGSSRKLRDCHGPLLLKIMQLYSSDNFMTDYIEIFQYLFERQEDKGVFRQYIPDRIKNAHNKRRKRKIRKR